MSRFGDLIDTLLAREHLQAVCCHSMVIMAILSNPGLFIMLIPSI